MVWLVEKKIFHHVLDLGFERIKIPVRIKFELEVIEGLFVSQSLAKEILYNRGAIEKHYPNVDLPSLDMAIEKMVDKKIREYLIQCGFLADNSFDAN